MATRVFLALLSSAAVAAWQGACPSSESEHCQLDAAGTESIPDVAAALQVSRHKINESAVGQSKLAPNSLIQGGFAPDDQPSAAGGSPSVHDICQDFVLRDHGAKDAVALSPRASPAKVIDTFAFSFASEAEELLLRFYEMGEEVSEFHIVEGDRDFTGEMKPYSFDEVLKSGQLDPWKDKIKYHQVTIPVGVRGYRLQEVQRQALRSQMNSYRDYDQNDMLLEGDLDEIVSHKVLQALKTCKPVGGVWKANVRMTDLAYSVAWLRTPGQLAFPTTIGFVSEGGALAGSLAGDNGFLHWEHELSAVDGSHIAWHFSFMLNGPAALAHKIFIRVEGRPNFAKEFRTEADLAAFLENNFYADPSRHDPELVPSKLGKKDLPQALAQHPEKFPSILRDVKW
eukprot:s2931_g4.t1